MAGKNKISFNLELEESLANSLRRYINQVLVLAIDEVEISKNDSPLYDETVAHRMGLIPLRSSKAISEKTSGDMKLNSSKEGYVYSGEMKGDFEVVYDKMPITLLNKNQEFEIKAKVKSGRGVEHAKFSPGIMFYRDVFDVKVDKDCPEEVVKLCPKKVFSLDKGKVVVENSEKCDMCEVCTEYCKKHKNESIKIAPKSELVITVESFGQITPKEMFEKSIDALKKDLNELAKKFK